MALAITISDYDLRYIRIVAGGVESDRILKINKDTCSLAYNDDQLIFMFRNVGMNKKDQTLVINYADVVSPAEIDTFHLYVQVQTYLMLNSL